MARMAGNFCPDGVKKKQDPVFVIKEDWLPGITTDRNVIYSTRIFNAE
jgi:hypothetical protein